MECEVVLRSIDAVECGSPPTSLTQDQLRVISGDKTQNLVLTITLQIRNFFIFSFGGWSLGLEGGQETPLSQEGNGEYSELCKLSKRSLRVSAGLWLTCGV